MKLNSINSDDWIRTRLTRVSRLAAFDASPVLNPDAGPAFDYVADQPGVIWWFNADGSLASVDVALESMRQRMVDIYRGTAGTGRRAFDYFGFEAADDPRALHREILEEHVRKYERFPAAKTG